jgi:hypothetical protein
MEFGVFLLHNKIELWLESGYRCTLPILGKMGEKHTHLKVKREKVTKQTLYKVLG